MTIKLINKTKCHEISGLIVVENICHALGLRAKTLKKNGASYYVMTAPIIIKTTGLFKKGQQCMKIGQRVWRTTGNKQVHW